MSEENTELSQEYLTFLLGSEEYAIDILKVQEIRSYEAATPIAQAPDFIKGVINLRGSIVPVIDLRIRFGLGIAEYTPFTVMVILDLGSRLVGIVVDGVNDVVQIKPSEVRPPPDFSRAVDVRYIEGLAMLDSRMLVLVDIERLMLSADMALVDEVLG